MGENKFQHGRFFAVGTMSFLTIIVIVSVLGYAVLHLCCLAC